MARNTGLIQSQILNAIASDPILSGLNSPSSTAIYKLIAFIIATSQATEEQLNDLFVTQVENQVNVLPPTTLQYAQANSFLFQYNTLIPQVIQFNTATQVPYYPTINPSYRLITNCSVVEALNAPTVYLKVAKGGSSTTVPQALAPLELQAFQNYWNTIKPVGIKYQCASLPADRIATEYRITYQGAYSSVIQATLLAAYNTYLFNIPFGGVVKKVDIDVALRAVPGVIDLVCEAMTPRPNSEAFGVGAQRMVLMTTILRPEYICASGYIIDEDTPGWDFLSNLTLVAV